MSLTTRTHRERPPRRRWCHRWNHRHHRANHRCTYCVVQRNWWCFPHWNAQSIYHRIGRSGSNTFYTFVSSHHPLYFGMLLAPHTRVHLYEYHSYSNIHSSYSSALKTCIIASHLPSPPNARHAWTHRCLLCLSYSAALHALDIITCDVRSCSIR